MTANLHVNHVRIGWSWDDVHQVWCLIEDGEAIAAVGWSDGAAELDEGWAWMVDGDLGVEETFEDACARAERAHFRRQS